MDNKKYVTITIDRETHERISKIAKELTISKSALLRLVFTKGVELKNLINPNSDGKEPPKREA